ncbi:MAG: MscL family protein [Patescibacteria group bacterium]
MLTGFVNFLKEYNIIGLALAFIMGLAANSLVSSLVSNLIMPLIQPLIPQGTWQDTTLQLGPVGLKWGAFVSELIHFLIIALVVYLIARNFLKEKEIHKK